MSFLQIPGNIKQQFAPFVLNPWSDLHKYVESSTKLKTFTTSPQYFTFRHKEGSFPSGIANLRFYPSSMDDLSINDDISFKLLYGSDSNNMMTPQSLTIRNVLDHMPAIQIREFLPDTRLDQCINMFVDLFANMAKMFTGDDSGEGGSTVKKTEQSKDNSSFADKLSQITTLSWYAIKYFVGGTKPNFYDDLGSEIKKDVPFSSYNDIYSDTNKTHSPGFYVMTFPYTLYYRLQSCVTTNVYEVPAIDSDKRILASGGGMNGWTDGSDFMSAGGFRLSGLLNKIPLIGNIANMILGNIGINYMPWWNAESGVKTKEPQITLKFDLFNDSYEAAMANFIFINTLVPNNKWIQYNMFQHSSSLYDVKIEGLNRLYACAGDMNVTYDGVLRDPPNEFIMNLVAKHANENMNNGNFFDNIVKNKLIKIPDVYHVSMVFQSLLPANFNNYIFNYAQNSNHMVKYPGKVYDESAFATILPGAMSKFGQRVKAVWNSEAKDQASAEAAAANAKTETPKAADSTDVQKQQQASNGSMSGPATTTKGNANTSQSTSSPNGSGGTIVVR